jgi:hypothetical protein
VPKAIVPETHFRSRELSSIGDDLWNGLKKHFPKSLTPEADARLRFAILQCCSWYLTENDRFKESRQTFAAMQSPGKGQPAGLERLANGLRIAADAWADIRYIHHDRLTNISRFDDLEGMVADAERRLAAFRATAPQTVDNPWPAFVREAARCLRAAGLTPGVTGRLYEANAKLTWFQKFIVALSYDVLGNEGPWPNNSSASDQAKAESVKAAMRGGGRKPGKARK